MTSLINRKSLQYGLFHWWPTSRRPEGFDNSVFDSNIHPNDIELANNLDLLQRVFVTLGMDNDYQKIGFGKYVLRINPIALKPVKGDGFLVGDQVKVLSRNGINTPRRGEIIDMVWHFKEEKIIYLLSENGKPLSKRYFAIDLELSNDY